MRWRRSGMVAKVALVRIAGVLVFGIAACGPGETGEPQHGERVGESMNLLGTSGPSVSEEIDVAERIRFPTTGWRHRIGAGATSHLIAFQDVQDDLASTATLFGVRVGFDGAILDPFPFAISTASGYQNKPKIAFNGADWLVTWQDGRVRFEEHIYAARVAGDGTVRDPDAIALATGPGSKEPSSVASDGTDFLVTWNVDGTQAAIVSASGTVERTFTVQAGSAGDSAVAFNGTHYLVAYCESGNLRAKRLTRAGDTMGPVIDFGAGCSNVEIASDGTDWMVAYPVTGTEVTWRVVAADGTLGPPGSTMGLFTPSITWGGSSYWLTGESSAPPTLSAHVKRLDRSGNELGSQVFSEHEGFQTQIAFGGSNAFVTFWGANGAANGSRVNESLEWLDTPPLVLSASESWQARVRSAWGGSEYLVVWWESGIPIGNADDHVAARRVGANGTPLGSSVQIPSGWNVQGGLHVASNGDGYLVAWQDPTAIRGTRVSPTGTVLDPAGISIAPDIALSALGVEPAVASNGTEYLVVWYENSAARGVRVLADGSIPAGPFTLSHSTVWTPPVVGANGSRYLVVWSGAGGLTASRVDSAGTVLDSSDLSIASEGSPGPLQVASDGSDWLVVWLTGGATQEIRGVRVGADGAVKDAPAITINAATSIQSPSAAWTGREYLVAWLHPLGGNTFALEGRRLSAQGRLIDPAAFSISTHSHPTFLDVVDITARGAGRALITYTRWDPTRPVATRAKARTFTSDLSEGGEGGGAGADSGGAGGRGGTDGGEAGQSSGAAGEAQGGSGRGGASGNGPTGGTAATTGGDSSGEAGDGSGHGSGRVVTEGCGCRPAGAPTNRSAVAVALVLCAFAFRRRKRSRKPRPSPSPLD